MVIPKPGDVFKFAITSDAFAFGRVMLNITTQCVDTKKIDKNNLLWAFQEYLLVEVYEKTTTGDNLPGSGILIPGILISGDCIEDKTWHIVDFKEVNPHDVEFPEGLSAEKAIKGALVKGECKVIFDIEFAEIERIDIPPSGNPCSILPDIVLYQLGRKDEINSPRLVDKEFMNPADIDLRFSPYREKIFGLAGLNEHEPYYEFSKRLGADIARFY